MIKDNKCSSHPSRTTIERQNIWQKGEYMLMLPATVAKFLKSNQKFRQLSEIP